MIRISPFLLPVFLFSTHFIFAQPDASNNTFIMPITNVVGVTGSFGEIRSDHFHSGIDIRTENRIGKEVRATNDGYISRIKVSPVGYGKSIFIDHPNGLTTGYGHLDKYADQIDRYIKRIQYQQKSFDVDVFPKPGELPVKKGDLIAYSGNSGGSSGPHLHYEVRTTIDQQIINPIPHFLDVVDSISPIIRSLNIYRLDSSSYANGYSRKIDILTYGAKGLYITNKRINAYGKIGIGVDVIDRLNYMSTQCGFKSITLKVNGKTYYNLTLDKFAFAETRYVNSIIDYATRITAGKEIVKLYADPANHFSGLHNLYDRGIITIIPDSLYRIEVLVNDASSNTSKLSFSIFGVTPPLKPESFNQTNDKYILLSYLLENALANDTFSLQLPKHSLYDNLFFQYSIINQSDYVYSPLIRLHNPQTPLHKKAKLEIKASNLPVKYQSKALLATFDSDHKVVSAGGEWKNGFVNGNISRFGDYFITIDTIAPEIIPIKVRRGSTLTNSPGIQVKIKDNFSGIKKIDGYIDGQWVLFDYDQKNSMIYYAFDKERIVRGKSHVLEIVVSDNKENLSRFQSEFIW